MSLGSGLCLVGRKGGGQWHSVSSDTSEYSNGSSYA